MSEITNQTTDLRSLSGSAPRLPAPVRITEQVWPEGTVPVVSVFCITYNHVNFIRDAIEGFFMQETTFPVEIFIHDDASSDGTAEIVKEYADKYPKLFWTILQTENQWSKGNKKILTDYLQKQRGEFIALCEGDDYWIAKEKLQKQVASLEGNRKFVGCCHDVKTNLPYSKTGFLYNGYDDFNGSSVKMKHLLLSNWMATGSVLIQRSAILDLPESFTQYAMGDWCMWIWCASKGDFFIDSEALGFYRAHEGGVWNSQDRDWQILEIIRMLSGISSAIDKKHEKEGLEGLLSYFSQFITPAFLGTKVLEFKEAKKLVHSCSWNQNKMSKNLGIIIQEQKILGEVGCGIKSLVNSFEICLYFRSSIQASGVGVKENCQKLAKSVASCAWVNKTARPFFALGMLVLAFSISLSGTIKTLHQLVGTSFGNLRKATASG